MTTMLRRHDGDDGNAPPPPSTGSVAGASRVSMREEYNNALRRRRSPTITTTTTPTMPVPMSTMMPVSTSTPVMDDKLAELMAAASRRSSVPMLDASTIDSLSSLSSSFEQYDSTSPSPTPTTTLTAAPGPPRPPPLRAATTSSSPARPTSRRTRSGNESLALSPATVERLRSDSEHWLRRLVAEHCALLEGRAERKPTSTPWSVVAKSKRVEVLEQPPTAPTVDGAKIRGPSPPMTTNKRSSRHQAFADRRFTARWTLRATIDEVIGLLARPLDDGHGDDDGAHNSPNSPSSDHDHRRFADVRAALSPETAHTRTLWEATVASPFDDKDDPAVDDENLNDHGPGDDSDDDDNETIAAVMASFHRRQQRRTMRRTIRGAWLGITWSVEQLPTVLSRDRDLLLLERLEPFTLDDGRRGFAHLRHSLEPSSALGDDPVSALGCYRLDGAFVRAKLQQSGLVIVESAVTPGTLEAASTMAIDFGGNIGAHQHRSIVTKRLLGMERLEELVWLGRVATAVAARRRLPAPVFPAISKTCARCEVRKMLFRRHHLEPCAICGRIVCEKCSRQCDLPRSLMPPTTTSSPKSREEEMHTHPADSGGPRPGPQHERLCVCGHCETEQRQPHRRLASTCLETTSTTTTSSRRSRRRRHATSSPAPPGSRSQRGGTVLFAEADAGAMPPPRRPSPTSSPSGRDAEALVDAFLLALDDDPALGSSRLGIPHQDAGILVGPD